jgi:hypothetical protein
MTLQHMRFAQPNPGSAVPEDPSVLMIVIESTINGPLLLINCVFLGFFGVSIWGIAAMLPSGYD